MNYKDCSTCAYSEMHDYADTFYCYNRDCHRYGDFREIHDCERWESKAAFKWGKCSECRFSKHDEETNTFTCNSKDRRQFIRPVNEKEHKDCPFCSPKPKEVPKPKEPQPQAEETSLFTSPAQKPLQLFCVTYAVKDGTRNVRMEFLVNAVSSEEADTLARECFDKMAYKGEVILGKPKIVPLAEKGVMSSSRRYL